MQDKIVLVEELLKMDLVGKRVEIRDCQDNVSLWRITKITAPIKPAIRLWLKSIERPVQKMSQWILRTEKISVTECDIIVRNPEIIITIMLGENLDALTGGTGTHSNEKQ